MSAWTIKQDDRRPYYIAFLKQNVGTSAEAAIDLTAASSVKFLMRLRSAAPGASPKVDAACSIVDAATGKVQYQWAAGDTDTAGEYEVEMEITWADATKQTVPSGGYAQVTVVEDLG